MSELAIERALQDGMPEGHSLLAPLMGRFSLSAAHDRVLARFMADGCLWRNRDQTKILISPRRPDGPALLLVINDDRPYLLDTVLLWIRRRSGRAGRILHPVLPIRRDLAGHALDLQGGTAESIICLELLEEGDLPGLRRDLAAALDAVELANRDETAIRDAFVEAVATLTPASVGISAFGDWLFDGHFIPLGLTLWDGAGPGPVALVRELGIPVESGMLELQALADAARHAGVGPLTITKLTRSAPVIRDSLLDAVILAGGGPCGTQIVILTGLFDPALAGIGVRDIPLLRDKVAEILQAAALPALSYDEKHLRRIFDILPREELFAAPAEAILHKARTILDLEMTGTPQLFLTPLRFGAVHAVLALIPREQYRPELEAGLHRLIEQRLGSSVLSAMIASDDYRYARFTTYLGAIPEGAVWPSIGTDLAQLLRSWDDRLGHLLRDLPDIAARYRLAFPVGCRDSQSPTAAVRDIAFLEQARRTGRIAVRYEGFDGQALTLYSPGQAASLSSILPIIEGLGLSAIGQTSYPVTLPHGEVIWVQRFALAPDAQLDGAEPVWREIAEVFDGVWAGRLENDALNGLIIRAGLSGREVALIRAIARYLRQVENALSLTRMARVLNRQGSFVRALADLFHARLSPDRAGNETAALQLLEAEQAAISDAEEDRLVTYFRLVVLATLRTNFYQREAGAPKPWITLKLDSGKLPFLPQPRPFVETWVTAPEVEGIHLRGGSVARGGLRWSDRPDDFRTEILGLMKAQRVKNAVIVPVGAKGGFVLRLPPTSAGKQDRQAQGVAGYRIFIRGLLDVTDTLVDGAVQRPERVLTRDGADPYLVVAADKGTARFSDIANAIARDYGFWLSDAFASGGSVGYDHKAMGITARGGWVAVRRHFLEMGIDPNREPITVAGIGDMSGDVFGNAMLLSRQIRLVAAFDHRHIFLDPDPDPATSWAERSRLFALAQSNWADYDQSRLSAGGGIYDRSAKTITVSAAACDVLDLPSACVPPIVLIRAILAARVDLLWFGGIGTYVKSTTESQAEAGDSANDRVRLNATELRTKIIGEGANLALTQRGRIEFARRGGRINTDAIDNSAGVACSDHEVNIKILLDLALSQGLIRPEQRDGLLASLTDAVASLVLADNHSQTLALSLAQKLGSAAADDFSRLMRLLERNMGLDRAVEALPDDDALAERAARGEGLCRPELAVLLAYTKLWVCRQLLASDLPDSPLAAGALRDYFPPALWQVAGSVAPNHRLRREIIATCLANQIVDHLGILFIPRIMERSGAGFARVFGTLLAVRAQLGLDALWASFDGPDQIGRMLALADEVEGLSIPLLARTASPDEAARVLALGRAALAADRPQSGLDELAPYPGIIYVAESLHCSIEVAAQLYFQIGKTCRLDQIRKAAARIRARTPWDRLAAEALADDLNDLQTVITTTVLREAASDLGDWARRRQNWLVEIEERLSDAIAGLEPDLAALMVVVRRIRSGACPLAVGLSA